MKSLTTKFVYSLARLMALGGGLVLAALVLMTTASIVGRALIPFGLAPIPGDFELVEMGIAFAVFAFLPWCQLQRGHATVELFTSKMGVRANAVLDSVSDILMFFVAGLLTWRLYLGMLDKRSYFETTFILQTPMWWGYAAALVGACCFTVVCAYCAIRSTASVFEPKQQEVHHEQS